MAISIYCQFGSVFRDLGDARLVSTHIIHMCHKKSSTERTLSMKANFSVTNTLSFVRVLKSRLYLTRVNGVNKLNEASTVGS